MHLFLALLLVPGFLADPGHTTTTGGPDDDGGFIQDVCIAVSTTGLRHCVFPFLYRGLVFDGCSKIYRSGGPKLDWCGILNTTDDEVSLPFSLVAVIYFLNFSDTATPKPLTSNPSSGQPPRIA